VDRSFRKDFAQKQELRLYITDYRMENEKWKIMENGKWKCFET
jgi:hypothetical protein